MTTPKFHINQTVLAASCGNAAKTFIECPECNGDKFVTVQAGRNPAVTVDCENCRVAYGEFSAGVVTVYTVKAEVITLTITCIEIRSDDTVEYRSTRGIFQESQLFHGFDRALAEAAAERLMNEHNAAELKRVERKEKPDRTWSWNASYHRKAIKEATRQLAYHTKKLEVAARLAKEGVKS